MSTPRLLCGLILLLALCLSACTLPAAPSLPEASPSPLPATQTPTLPTPSIPAPPTAPPPAPSATPPPPDPAALPPASYHLVVTLDFAAHSLAVAQSLDYPNRGQQALDELVLMVEPNRWEGVFQLHSLKWNDATPIQEYTLEANTLRIPLPAPLPPGERLQLSLAYTLVLPPVHQTADSFSVDPFGYTACPASLTDLFAECQLNLVDWYPVVPPYDPENGWLAHPDWYYGEHQVYEMADFQVELSPAEALEGLVIAASAPAVQQGERLLYQVEGARNLVFSISPLYQTQSTEVDGIRVTSYYFAHHQAAGEMALQNTLEALALYNQRFGIYPYPSLSVVEADFADGMEYSGMFFLSGDFYNLYNGTPSGYLTAIAAHETAHQWWYGIVGNDQALEPWLDESLCTYSERLYYETYHPDSLRWWWDYRIAYYQPQGFLNLGIYDYTGYRPYRDAVYLNGAIFLEELRTLIGDEAFFAFLGDYAARRAAQIATTEDFFAILKEHTNADLSALLAKYFVTSENLP